MIVVRIQHEQPISIWTEQTKPLQSSFVHKWSMAVNIETVDKHNISDMENNSDVLDKYTDD